MKRPLFFCGSVFVASTAVCYYLGHWPALTLTAILAVGVLWFWAARCRGSKQMQSLACHLSISVLLALAAVAVSAAYMHWQVLPITSLVGESCEVNLTVTHAETTGRYIYGEGIANLKLEDGRSFDNVGVRFVWYGDEQELLSGQSLYAAAQIAGVGVGEGTISRRISQGQYIAVRIPAGIELHGSPAHPFMSFMANLRYAVAESTAEYVGGDAGALLGAVLTGGSNRLSQTARSRLQLSGLAHLTAVSGMHIALAANGAAVFLGGYKNRYSYLPGVILAFFYAALAGFTPSAVRAALMFLLVALARVLYVQADGLTSLALAGIVLCAANPLVVGDIGFWLSFCSSLGMFMLADPVGGMVSDWIEAHFGKHKLPWLPMRATLASLGSAIFSAPVAAAAFGYLPLLGIMANVMVVAILPYLLPLAALVAVCGTALPAAATLFAFPARLAAGYILGVARVVSDMPFSRLVITEAYQIVLLLGLCGLAVTLSFSRPQRRVLYAAVCCATIISGTTFAGHWFLYGSSYQLLRFTQTGASAIVRGREAVVMGMPDDAYHAMQAANALSRMGVNRVVLLQGEGAQSARLFAGELPVDFCLLDDGSWPVGVLSDVSPQGGELRALGLTLQIDGSGVVTLEGEKLDEFLAKYDILAQRHVRLMSMWDETERYAIRR